MLIIAWFLIFGFIWIIWYGFSTIWSMKRPDTNNSFFCVEDYILVDTPWEYITHYNTWSRYNW